MNLASIPVDLVNPGQVFGCLGFMEAALAVCGSARAVYDWSDAEDSRFYLEVPGEMSGFETVLRFLADAEVVSQSPNADLSTDKWKQNNKKKISTEHPATASSSSRQFPIASPDSPATLPAVLRAGNQSIAIYHWGDTTIRDNVKFWAGSGGYPGAVLLKDALDLVRDRLVECADDPFAVSVAQKNSFRFDWRRDYIALDAGFSLNAHEHIIPQGYPLVEIMAAIGVSHARPRRATPHDKLHYQYTVMGRANTQSAITEMLLPPALLRAALGGIDNIPFATRRFEIFLGWPGREGDARCITRVIEETAI